MDEFENIDKNRKQEEKLRKKYEKKAEKLIKKEEKKAKKIEEKENKNSKTKKPMDKMKLITIIVAIIAIASMLFSVC